MLNISNNLLTHERALSTFKCSSILRRSKKQSTGSRILVIVAILLLIALFLPWTQNIIAKGYVTTRSPDQRPQAIQSIIAGRIEKWYVQEGDTVAQGDTIAFITEIKGEYFDPELVDRTQEQYDAKSESVLAYDDKIAALERQYEALVDGRRLKLESIDNKIKQTINKIKIDSVDLQAFIANDQIAANQVERIRTLYEAGAKTLSELQDKEFKQQETGAKVLVQRNKLVNQRTELDNLRVQRNADARSYDEKLAKVRSDQQTARSNKLTSVSDAAKMKNLVSTYTKRQDYYYITAPQAGFVTKTVKKGIGETLKEGSDICTIMPLDVDLAVETYMKPQDIPLLAVGNIVRLRFDGWPAIVISGWPEASTGIFAGRVVAIDQYISDNGHYRILISPDPQEKPWPVDLKVGTGTNAFALLKDVPIWYEVWRQLNGFPPDYYKGVQQDEGY